MSDARTRAQINLVEAELVLQPSLPTLPNDRLDKKVLLTMPRSTDKLLRLTTRQSESNIRSTARVSSVLLGNLPPRVATSKTCSS